MAKIVLITGGTGLIGSHIAPLLKSMGWRTRLLSRSRVNLAHWDEIYTWNPESGEIETDAMNGVTHILHLAGAGISEKRWTDARKKKIAESRIQSAYLLHDTLLKSGNKIDTFVSASGIGWYGMITDEKVHTEDEPAAADFMGNTCHQWEASADQFSALGCRVVKLRTGIVLARDGGALPVLSRPVKLFTGCILGTGNQQMPWIHIDDLCRLYAEALENTSWNGAFNAVATDNCTHQQFMITLAKTLHRPLWPFRIPSGVLRLFLGEMAGVITEGSRISNKKLLDLSGDLKFNDLQAALTNLLNHKG